MTCRYWRRMTGADPAFLVLLAEAHDHGAQQQTAGMLKGYGSRLHALCAFTMKLERC